MAQQGGRPVDLDELLRDQFRLLQDVQRLSETPVLNPQDQPPPQEVGYYTVDSDIHHAVQMPQRQESQWFDGTSFFAPGRGDWLDGTITIEGRPYHRKAGPRYNLPARNGDRFTTGSDAVGQSMPPGRSEEARSGGPGGSRFNFGRRGERRQ